jgi:hypothetical protein
MYIPPPDTNQPLEYWKNEAEYRRNKLRKGGLTGEFLVLLWYLVKWVILVVTLPVRFFVAQWRKQTRQRKLKS